MHASQEAESRHRRHCRRDAMESSAIFRRKPVGSETTSTADRMIKGFTGSKVPEPIDTHRELESLPTITSPTTETALESLDRA